MIKGKRQYGSKFTIYNLHFVLFQKPDTWHLSTAPWRFSLKIKCYDRQMEAAEETAALHYVLETKES